MNNVCIIVDIAQAHDGSLGILHSFIDAVAQTGVDVIKFQTHIADAESSEYEPFRVNFSHVDNTRLEYWKRMEFTKEQWLGIKQHCEEAGLEFMSSPFSNAAVDLLHDLGMQRFKIGSGEVSNFLLLERIANTGKKIILSSGMSNFEELDKTIEFLKPFGNDLSILQCSTKYPTSPEDIGLNVLPELKERYQLPVGLSDHSGTIYPGIAASALGAELIEVHATFDKRMFGPDARSSLTIDELRQLVEGVRFIETSLKYHVNKYDNSQYTGVKKIFEKSLAVNKDLSKGHKITSDDLEGKKPAGYGIPARNYQDVLGRILKVDKRKYEFLKEEDLQ